MTGESFRLSNLGFFCVNTKSTNEKRGTIMKKHFNKDSECRWWVKWCDCVWPELQWWDCVHVPWWAAWSLELDDDGSDSRSDWASVCYWAAAFWQCHHGRSVQTLPSQLWSCLTAVGNEQHQWDCGATTSQPVPRVEQLDQMSSFRAVYTKIYDHNLALLRKRNVNLNLVFQATVMGSNFCNKL